MSEPQVRLKYHNKFVVADTTRTPWVITALGGEEIPWRVLLFAPCVDRTPVVLVNDGDLELLERSARLGDTLDRALRQALRPPTAEHPALPEPEPEPPVREPRRELIELVLRVAPTGPEAPLTLYDDTGDSIPVFHIEEDLQARKAPKWWQATSCLNYGSSTLYEVPFIRYPPAGQAVGRHALVSADGMTYFDFTNPTASTPPLVGDPPPGNPPFVVRAAKHES
jgi:hypothetical protein